MDYVPEATCSCVEASSAMCHFSYTLKLVFTPLVLMDPRHNVRATDCANFVDNQGVPYVPCGNTCVPVGDCSGATQPAEPLSLCTAALVDDLNANLADDAYVKAVTDVEATSRVIGPVFHRGIGGQLVPSVMAYVEHHVEDSACAYVCEETNPDGDCCFDQTRDDCGECGGGTFFAVAVQRGDACDCSGGTWDQFGECCDTAGFDTAMPGEVCGCKDEIVDDCGQCGGTTHFGCAVGETCGCADENAVSETIDELGGCCDTTGFSVQEERALCACDGSIRDSCLECGGDVEFGDDFGDFCGGPGDSCGVHKLDIFGQCCDTAAFAVGDPALAPDQEHEPCGCDGQKVDKFGACCDTTGFDTVVPGEQCGCADGAGISELVDAYGKCCDTRGFDSQVPGDVCNCDGEVWDSCGVCGGTLVIGSEPGQLCDCDGNVRDEHCDECGHYFLPDDCAAPANGGECVPAGSVKFEVMLEVTRSFWEHHPADVFVADAMESALRSSHSSLENITVGLSTHGTGGRRRAQAGDVCSMLGLATCQTGDVEVCAYECPGTTGNAADETCGALGLTLCGGADGQFTCAMTCDDASPPPPTPPPTPSQCAMLRDHHGQPYVVCGGSCTPSGACPEPPCSDSEFADLASLNLQEGDRCGCNGETVDRCLDCRVISADEQVPCCSSETRDVLGNCCMDAPADNFQPGQRCGCHGEVVDACGNCGGQCTNSCTDPQAVWHVTGTPCDCGEMVPSSTCTYHYTVNVTVMPGPGSDRPIGRCVDALQMLVASEFAGAGQMGVLDVADVKAISMVRPLSIDRPPQRVCGIHEIELDHDCVYSCDYSDFADTTPGALCGCQDQRIDECGVCGGNFLARVPDRAGYALPKDSLCGCPSGIAQFLDENGFLNGWIDHPGPEDTSPRIDRLGGCCDQSSFYSNTEIGEQCGCDVNEKFDQNYRCCDNSAFGHTQGDTCGCPDDTDVSFKRDQFLECCDTTGFEIQSPGQVCGCDGQTRDDCGECGGSAIFGDLPGQACSSSSDVQCGHERWDHFGTCCLADWSDQLELYPDENSVILSASGAFVVGETCGCADENAVSETIDELGGCCDTTGFSVQEERALCACDGSIRDSCLECGGDVEFGDDFGDFCGGPGDSCGVHKLDIFGQCCDTAAFAVGDPALAPDQEHEPCGCDGQKVDKFGACCDTTGFDTVVPGEQCGCADGAGISELVDAYGKCCDTRGFDSQVPGDVCNCDGEVWDSCGVCGGTLVIGSEPGQLCDCDGNVRDEHCDECGQYPIDPLDDGQYTGRCDAAGTVRADLVLQVDATFWASPDTFTHSLVQIIGDKLDYEVSISAQHVDIQGLRARNEETGPSRRMWHVGMLSETAEDSNGFTYGERLCPGQIDAFPQESECSDSVPEECAWVQDDTTSQCAMFSDSHGQPYVMCGGACTPSGDCPLLGSGGADTGRRRRTQTANVCTALGLIACQTDGLSTCALQCSNAEQTDPRDTCAMLGLATCQTGDVVVCAYECPGTTGNAADETCGALGLTLCGGADGQFTCAMTCDDASPPPPTPPPTPSQCAMLRDHHGQPYVVCGGSCTPSGACPEPPCSDSEFADLASLNLQEGDRCGCNGETVDRCLDCRVNWADEPEPGRDCRRSDVPCEVSAADRFDNFGGCCDITLFDNSTEGEACGCSGQMVDRFGQCCSVPLVGFGYQPGAACGCPNPGTNEEPKWDAFEECCDQSDFDLIGAEGGKCGCGLEGYPQHDGFGGCCDRSGFDNVTEGAVCGCGTEYRRDAFDQCCDTSEFGTAAGETCGCQLDPEDPNSAPSIDQCGHCFAATDQCEPTCTDTDAFNYRHWEGDGDHLHPTKQLSDYCHCESESDFDISSFLPSNCEYEYTVKLVFAPSTKLYQGRPIGRLPICMEDLMKVIEEQIVIPDLQVLGLAGINVTHIVTEPELDPPKHEWTEEWRTSRNPRVATYTAAQVVANLGSPLGNSDPFCKYCDYTCDYTVYADAMDAGDPCGCQGQVLDDCGVCDGPFHFGPGPGELCACPAEEAITKDANDFLLEDASGYVRDDCSVCLDTGDAGTFFGTEPGAICGCRGETVDDCGACNGTSVLGHTYPGALCSCAGNGAPGDRIDNFEQCCDTTHFPDLDDHNRLFFDYDEVDVRILTGNCANELLQCTDQLDWWQYQETLGSTEVGMLVEVLLASALRDCRALQMCYGDERARILGMPWEQAAGQRCGCEFGLAMDDYGQCCTTLGFDLVIPWQSCGCDDTYTRDAFGRCCDTSKFRGDEHGVPADSAKPAVRDNQGVLRNVTACGCAYMDGERRVVPSKDEFGMCCDHSDFGTEPGAPCGCDGQVMDWEGKKCEKPLDICGECDRDIGEENGRVPAPYKTIDSEADRLKCKCDFCQECTLDVLDTRKDMLVTSREGLYYEDGDLLVIAPGDELQVQAEFLHTVHALNPDPAVYLLNTTDGMVSVVLMDGDTEVAAATQLEFEFFWFQARKDGAGVRATFSIPDGVNSGVLDIAISYTTLAGVDGTMTKPVAVVDADPPDVGVAVFLDYGRRDPVCEEEAEAAGCYDCSCSFADLESEYAVARDGTCGSRSRTRERLLQHCSGASSAGLGQTIVVNITISEPAERDLTVLEPVINSDDVRAFSSMEPIFFPARPLEFFYEFLVIKMTVADETAEGYLRMSSTAALADRLGNAGEAGSLYIPSDMEFEIDTTPPTVEVESIQHDADGTVTLVLTASEAIVPPQIYIGGCKASGAQNCDFNSGLRQVPMSDLFSTTHTFTYTKDATSPTGTFPLIFNTRVVGFDGALNRIGCSRRDANGNELCEELTEPGQVSCFTTSGNPCELVIDRAAPELAGNISVATSNALDNLHVKVGDTVTIDFSVSEQLDSGSPTVALVNGIEDGVVAMQIAQAAGCTDPCLDYEASLTIEDTIFEGPADIQMSLTDVWGNMQTLHRGSPGLPIIVVDTTPPVAVVQPRATKLYSVYKFNLDPDNSKQGLRDWDAANSIQLAEITLFGLGGQALHEGLTCTNPQGNNPTGEAPEDACDGFIYERGQPAAGGSGHKWLDFNKGDLVMTYEEPVAVAAWDWQTANDERDRDPTYWNLEGSNDGRTWAVLDSTPSGFVTSRERFAWQGPFEIRSLENSLSSVLVGQGDILSVVVTTSEPVQAISVDLAIADAENSAPVRLDELPVEVRPYAKPTRVLSHAYFTHDESRQFKGFAVAVLDFTGMEGELSVAAVDIVDLVGNTGSDAYAEKTVTVDTTPPVVSVSITASDDASFVVAPIDGTSVTVTGELSADEPVTMPYVVVNGVPVITKPAGADVLSVLPELMLPAVFSWADVDMDGFLSYAESQQLMNATGGLSVGAKYDYASYGRIAGQLRAAINFGFTRRELMMMYEDGKMPNTLWTDYSVLIGYDELTTTWEFEYAVTKDDFAGELAVLVQHAADLNGNVGDDVTSAATPLTVQCGDGYWGDGSPCALYTVCTPDEHQTSEPSGVVDRVCTPNTVCKTVEYYATQAQLSAVGDVVRKAALSSSLPPAVVDTVGAAYLDKIGGQDIAKLKALLSNGKSAAVETWLMAQSDSQVDAASLRTLLPALSELPLQYTTAPATDTEDTVCASVTACDVSSCKFEVEAPTATANTICSAPCAGHGQCVGDGRCECWATCSGADSSCGEGDFLNERVDDNCPDTCVFQEWVGGVPRDGEPQRYSGSDTRCRTPKLPGCTTFSAENFNRLANYDDQTCEYKPCEVKPCQRGGICTCAVPEGSECTVNEFECLCPAGYDGDRCQRQIPRYTSPANSFVRGPNLAGAESGGIGLLQMIPMDQFNMRRQYSDFAEATADLNAMVVSLSSSENTLTVLRNDVSVLEQADGSFTFGITYSVENTGGSNLQVQLTIQSQQCIETASESMERDATACAAVTELSSAQACLAVRTEANQDQAACDYKPLFGGQALELTIASGVGAASATTSEAVQIGTGPATAGQAAQFEITLVDAYGTLRSEACPDDCATLATGCAHDCGTPAAATCTITAYGTDTAGEDQDACALESNDAMQSDCIAIIRGGEPICQYNAGLAVVARKNLALGQPTDQSSTGWGGSHARAVDGNADSNYWGNSCTHSDGTPAWWQVDLGTAGTVVETVVVTHRSDCCQDRLLGAKIYVGNSALSAPDDNPDTADGWSVLGELTNADGGAETISAASTITGQYVVVHMDPATSTGAHMTLCEVEVYGSTALPAVDSSDFVTGATGGSYLASWATETAGQYRLEFSLHGDVLGCAADGTCDYGQVQTITVESADTSADHSVVTRGDDEFTDTAIDMQAGGSLEFTVTAKDSYGNENEDGTKGGELTVGLKGGKVTVTHVENEDGTNGGVYTVVAMVGPKGTYNLELQIGGVDLFDPPKLVIVSSGAASATASVVNGLVPRGTAGQQAAVIVIPRDQFGTRCDSGSTGDFVLVVDNSADASAFPPAVPGTSGEYVLEQPLTWNPATCDAADGSVEDADVQACADVSDLSDATACEAVMQVGTEGVRACSYTPAHYTSGVFDLNMADNYLSAVVLNAGSQYTALSSSGTVVRDVRAAAVSASGSSLSVCAAVAGAADADVDACAAVSELSDPAACEGVQTAASDDGAARACEYDSQAIKAGETDSVTVTLKDAFQNEPEYDARSEQETLYATATAAGDIADIACNADSPCMCSAVQAVEAGSFCVVNLRNGKFQVKYAFATAETYTIEIFLARDPQQAVGGGFPVIVTAGAVSATGSIIATVGDAALQLSHSEPSAIEAALSGVASSDERVLYIHARDAYGNEVSVPDASVCAVLVDLDQDASTNQGSCEAVDGCSYTPNDGPNGEACVLRFDPIVRVEHLTEQLATVVVGDRVDDSPDIMRFPITLEAVGDYAVSAELAGKPIGSELRASVSHAPVSATQSTVLPGWVCSGNADNGGLSCDLDPTTDNSDLCPAGCSRTFNGLNTVETVAYVGLRDEFGNVVTAPTSVTMRATVGGETVQVEGTRTDTDVPGTYMLQHLFAEDVEDVEFRADGARLQPLYRVSIAAGIGHVDAASSLIVQPDATVDVAGVPTEFFIEARDAGGILATGADCAQVDLQLEDARERCEELQKTEASNNVGHMCFYTPASGANAASCASVPCADEQGASVECIFEGSVVSGPVDPEAQVSFTGASAGIYSATFIAQKKGTYTIEITLAGIRVGTIDREVGAAAPAAATSTVALPGAVTAGAAASFTVKMYDQFENEVDALTRTDDNLITAVYGKTELAVSRSATDGSYEVVHTFERAWACPSCFAILYDGVHTVAGPYTVTVAPGDIAPERSLVQKASGGLPKAGSSLSLVVITRDEFDNRREASSGSDVTLAMVDGLSTNSISADDVASCAGLAEQDCNAAEACQYSDQACLHALITVSDTNNGQYEIVYRHLSAGTYRLDVSVAGTVLPAAAFEDEDNTVTISPGAVSLADGDTVVQGDGMSAASAGQPTSFTVRTRDSYQNAIVDSSLPIQAALTFDESCNTCKFAGAKSTFSNGEFTFTYTATALGNYQLNVKIGGVAVAGSPFSVEVTHGALDLDRTSRQITVAKTFSAGQEVAVIVQPSDEFGNTVPAVSCRGAEDCAATFAGGSGISSCPAHCTYTEHVPGTFSFAISDENLETVMLTNPVISEDTDPDSAFAGQMVGRFNREQNEVQNAGEYTLAVSYTVFSEQCTPTNSDTACSLDGQGCTVDSGNGACTYVPAVQHALTGDGGITLVASPAEFSPDHCELTPASLMSTPATIIAGQTALASLRGYDTYGNAIAVGGAVVSALAESEASGVATVADLADAEDSTPGMYTISFYSEKANPTGHEVSVTVDSQPVKFVLDGVTIESYHVVVLPGSLSTASEFAIGTEDSDVLSQSITAGETEEFKVLALDMYGNPEPTVGDSRDAVGAEHFIIAVRTATATSYEEQQRTVGSVVPGTFNVEFTPDRVGSYEVIVTLASGGEAIHGPADGATVNVQADMAPSREQCVVNWSSGGPSALVGQAAKVYVYLRDRFGNPQHSADLENTDGDSRPVTMAISQFTRSDNGNSAVDSAVHLTPVVAEDDPDHGYKFTLEFLVGGESGSCSDGSSPDSSTCESSDSVWTWQPSATDGDLAGDYDVTISMTHDAVPQTLIDYALDPTGNAVTIGSGLQPIFADNTQCSRCSSEDIVIAGELSSFELEVRDTGGTLVPAGVADGNGKDYVDFTVTSDGATPTVDVVGAVYRVSFIATSAGMLLFDVVQDSVALSHIRPSVTVVPAGLDVAQTTVDPGVPAMTAGEPGSFGVVLKDQFSNEISSIDASTTLAIDVMSGTDAVASARAGCVFTEMAGSMRFQCIVYSEAAGEFALSVSLNTLGADAGLPIPASPFALAVSPAVLNGDRTTIEGSALRNAVAGSPAQFNITARDAFGNRLQAGGDASLLELQVTQSGLACCTSDYTPETETIADNQDGTYTATYVVTQVGGDPYILTGMIDGIEKATVRGITVTPNVPHSEMSQMAGAAEQGRAVTDKWNAAARFTVDMFDRWGNAVTDPDQIADVSVAITHGIEDSEAQHGGIRPKLRRNTAIFKYKVTESGPWDIVVTFADAAKAAETANWAKADAPEIDTATIKANGRGLLVRFDKKTNRGGKGNVQFPCADLLADTTDALLGTGAQCKWRNARTLNVRWGKGTKAANVYDTFELKADSNVGQLGLDSEYATLGSPMLPPDPEDVDPPIVDVRYQATLGPCDDMIMDASGSVDKALGAPQTTEFFFFVDSEDGLRVYAQINQGSKATIPADVLAANTRYVFSVMLRNSYDQEAVFDGSFYKEGQPIPGLDVAFNKELDYTKPAFLRGQVKLSTCASTELCAAIDEAAGDSACAAVDITGPDASADQTACEAVSGCTYTAEAPPTAAQLRVDLLWLPRWHRAERKDEGDTYAVHRRGCAKPDERVFLRTVHYDFDHQRSWRPADAPRIEGCDIPGSFEPSAGLHRWRRHGRLSGS